MRHLTALLAILIIASFVVLPNAAAAHGAAAPGTYTVRSGDTLSKIARAHGLSSWQVLYAANRDRLRNPNVIRVGQVLTIPGSNGAAAPAPQHTPSQPAPAPSSGNITDIITAAAKRYGQSPAAMIAVATCESGLNPRAVNRSSNASGLFQFLPSTWRTTPYAGQNIFDPVANANAAAWMWSVGRQNEWVCKA